VAYAPQTEIQRDRGLPEYDNEAFSIAWRVNDSCSATAAVTAIARAELSPTY
jgi:hypothetical protein